jgi:protein-S-isoprenylcysteine O-methyltransferase Ste14
MTAGPIKVFFFSVKVILKEVKGDLRGNTVRKWKRNTIYVLVVLLIVLYFSLYIISVAKSCENTLASRYVIFAMYYLTFAMMMWTSYLQWKKIKEVKQTEQSQRRRHQIITLVFGLSYLVRAFYNTF